MKNKKLIVFGEGLYAEIVHQYFTDDSQYEIAAFTKDDNYRKSEQYLGLPMIDFSVVEVLYPPSEYDMFIAISYTEMNHLRERKYFEAKQKGYKLASYVSSKCSWMTKKSIGDNSFIFEDNTIQPFVKIGNNVILWSGNHIGHHSTIEDHNFISSHVVISGQCTIKPFCFLGVNCSIAHGTKIESETLVGAGSCITKNTEPKSVYVPAKSIKLDKTSDMFKL
jgi:sugar O-acyltransferase (sialic acid O-acetyltransferase NeuD family)